MSAAQQLSRRQISFAPPRLMLGNWWKRAWFPTFSRLHRRWRERFTPGGKVVAAIILLCLPGVWSLHYGHLQLSAALAVMLLLVWLANWCLAPKLSAVAVPPLTVDANQPFKLPVKFTNKGKLAAFDFHLKLADLPESWLQQTASEPVSSLAASDASVFEPKIIAARRGRYRLPRLEATSCFPLNLCRRISSHQLEGEVIVLPDYDHLELAGLVEPGLSEGDAGSMQRGASCYATGIREYQPGTPVRRWDYASWARLGYPVVREYEECEQQQATIVLDIFADETEQQSEDFQQEFEESVSKAAALAHALHSASIHIGSLWIGGQFHHFDAATADSCLIDLMVCLAIAQPDPAAGAKQGIGNWQDQTDSTTYVVVRNAQRLQAMRSQLQPATAPVVFVNSGEACPHQNQGATV